ncbi:Uncharacterized protein APZ42_019480 [Daphnia magna]|uniref:Uncharacterized protein n=1 Tax=Daphnia magna TaxID=35525 RepID=A0A0P6BF64_9CRUS|nr:Uncharacterized protein APZ42_019480 [Daphnia magna]
MLSTNGGGGRGTLYKIFKRKIGFQMSTFFCNEKQTNVVGFEVSLLITSCLISYEMLTGFLMHSLVNF